MTRILVLFHLQVYIIHKAPLLVRIHAFFMLATFVV